MTLSLIFIVKVDGVIEIPPYELFLVNNSKYMPICSILWNIATQNMHDLELDVSRSLTVKVNGVIRKPTYDFLLLNIYNYMLICIGSWVIGVWNFYPHKAPLYEKFQSAVNDSSPFKLGDVLGTDIGIFLQ